VGRLAGLVVYLLTAAVILTGVLAPADPLVLETVEVRRVRYGWGLDSFAGVGVLRIAVDDCAWLGYDGAVFVDGVGHRATVVDCCERAGCLADSGLAADVNDARLGHREATVILWF
jgi:hypothetical protein